MLTQRGLILQRVLLIAVLHFRLIGSKEVDLNDLRGTTKSGRYIPALYNADAGKYTPDLRGKYQHVPVPYDGGYGDRGAKYVHDLQRILQEQFALGPQDHLRFMIDFNYNGTGWQIIQFDWVRDGDEQHQYNYVNHNKLWSNGEQEPSYEKAEQGYSYHGEGSLDGKSDFGDADTVGAENTEQTNAAVNFADNMQDNVDNVAQEEQSSDPVNYDVTITSDNVYNSVEHNDIQQVIHQVLDYIQDNIIPTLK